MDPVGIRLCIQYSSTEGWPLERKWTLSDFTDALQLIQVFSQLGRNTDEETSPLLKFLNDFYSIILHRSKKKLGKNLSQIIIESYELESLWHWKSLTKHCFKVQVYLVRKSGFSELVQRNHGELWSFQFLSRLRENPMGDRGHCNLPAPHYLLLKSNVTRRCHLWTRTPELCSGCQNSLLECLALPQSLKHDIFTHQVGAAAEVWEVLRDYPCPNTHLQGGLTQLEHYLLVFLLWIMRIPDSGAAKLASFTQNKKKETTKNNHINQSQIQIFFTFNHNKDFIFPFTGACSLRCQKAKHL